MIKIKTIWLLVAFSIGWFNSQSLLAFQETGSWMTTPDRSKELSWEAGLSFKTQAAASPIIEINTAATYQTIDGFGFSLTGGSAGLINQKLNQQQRAELLQALFTRKSNGIGISYLRISIGASDLDDHVFSYDDLPDGATDYSLSKFSLEPDRKDLIPIIKQILKLVLVI